MTKTNLKKDPSGKFTVGGFARSRAWGTRIYKVLEVSDGTETLRRKIPVILDGVVMEYVLRFEEVEVTRVRLAKIAETNKGNTKYCNSKPFEVNNLPGSTARRSGTLGWYYPAKAV